MNFNFKPVGNTRTQKDEFSKNLIATAQTGTFRIPPHVSNLMDLSDGDSVSAFTSQDEETKEVYHFLAKGYNGEPLLDENGEIVRGNRNIIVYQEGKEMDGSVVRHTTPDSKVMTITSASMWRMLGGNNDVELELSVKSIGEMPYPLNSGRIVEGEVFQIEVVKTRELDTKEKDEAKKETEKAAAEDADVADAIADENFVEEEV